MAKELLFNLCGATYGSTPIKLEKKSFMAGPVLWLPVVMVMYATRLIYHLTMLLSFHLED
jgi:hypothetical protein